MAIAHRLAFRFLKTYTDGSTFHFVPPSIRCDVLSTHALKQSNSLLHEYKYRCSRFRLSTDIYSRKVIAMPTTCTVFLGSVSNDEDDAEDGAEDDA